MFFLYYKKEDVVFMSNLPNKSIKLCIQMYDIH